LSCRPKIYGPGLSPFRIHVTLARTHVYLAKHRMDVQGVHGKFKTDFWCKAQLHKVRIPLRF
jgi:hypothetical protein